MNLRFLHFTSCKLVAMLLFSQVFLSSLSAQNDKFKALFIYNFTNNIEWPEKGGDEFKIAIVGNSDLVSELKEISSRKTVGKMKIVAFNAKSSDNLSDCQIVFISKNKNGELSNVVRTARENHILLITETENSCYHGAGINFTTKNGNLHFEISKNNIIASGLKISNNLISMGTLVN